MPNVPSAQAQSGQTMCLCFPLRLGVLFAAALTFLSSVFYCLDRGHWNYVFRHLTGGYTLASQFVVGAAEVTGVPFGLLGILGAWYAKDDYIASFNLWQMFRILAWLVMYWFDIPTLRECDAWVNNVQQMTEQHGWNALMYQIAVAGNCPGERTRFFVFSFLTLVVFMYLVSATARYHTFMTSLPKHLLRIPKDLTSGAFYAHSAGERAYLNGTYGEHERGPAGPPPPFQGQAFGFAPPAFGSMPPVGGAAPPGSAMYPPAGPPPAFAPPGSAMMGPPGAMAL